MKSPTENTRRITSTPTTHLLRATLPSNKKAPLQVTSAADIIARQLVRMQRFRPPQATPADNKTPASPPTNRLRVTTAGVKTSQRKVSQEARNKINSITVGGRPTSPQRQSKELKPVDLKTVRIPVQGERPPKGKHTKRVDLSKLHSALS